MPYTIMPSGPCSCRLVADTPDEAAVAVVHTAIKARVLGNAAGTTLHRVQVVPGLGNWSKANHYKGFCVVIEHSGMPLAHTPDVMPAARKSEFLVVAINGGELPTEEHDIEIRK